jgi:rSAM/selenodomain-associated transferase 1
MRTTGSAESPAARPSCGIAVMAKASTPGRTKTRLVPPLTHEKAALCNTAFLRDIADNILAAAKQTSIAGYMAFGPPDARPFFQEQIPGAIGLIEAWHSDFGQCLHCAIVQVLERGHVSAVVLNSDSPTLPTSLLVETAEVLACPGERIVLGPADDGGYYLLGLKRGHRRLFEDITWSTEHVARQTLDRAAELELPVHVLPTWYDVDDASALRTLQAELFDGRSFAPELRPNRPRHTLALMQSLLETSDLEDRLGCNAFGRAAE